jgi:putative membrane protein
MVGSSAMRILFALTGSLWIIYSAFAQAPQLGATDKDFIKAAASNGMAEIQLGKLASSRASREEVQEFARRLEKDHGEANVELLKIIDSQGLDVPRDMEPYLAAAKHLESLKGEAFDRAYLQHIVQEHEEAIAHFTKEAQQGQNPQLKDYASKTLPRLREHLQRARELAAGQPK